MIPVWGVRRFTEYREDGRCFELFNLKTGACESFPNTRKVLERYAKARNREEEGRKHETPR